MNIDNKFTCTQRTQRRIKVMWIFGLCLNSMEFVFTFIVCIVIFHLHVIIFLSCLFHKGFEWNLHVKFRIAFQNRLVISRRLTSNTHLVLNIYLPRCRAINRKEISTEFMKRWPEKISSQKSKINWSKILHSSWMFRMGSTKLFSSEIKKR